MIEHNLDCLPVIDDGGRLLGMITEENFLRWTTEQMAGSENRNLLSRSYSVGSRTGA